MSIGENLKTPNLRWVIGYRGIRNKMGDFEDSISSEKNFMAEYDPIIRESEEPRSRTWEGGCLWMGIGVIFGGLTLGILFVFVSMTRISRIDQEPKPEVTVIAAATSTPIKESETFPDGGGMEEATPTLDIVVSEVFSEGDLVEVFGTEGQGLSLRDAPGLSSVVEEYGLESEVFEIYGGPIDADGYTWWYLVNPYDKTKQGWGVGRYLRNISS